MKAIIFSQYGSAEALELKQVARPEPGADELLVRIHASSINSWDWEYLNGTPFINRLMFGLLRPKPGKQRLGADIAGTVEAVGERVTRFQPGDEVFGDLWDRWGGFAEYACAPASSMQPKPANLSFVQAAAVPQAGVLALQGLLKGGHIKPGQQVLINGAGGGVGSFAIQLARLDGAEVTAVDTAHKLATMRALGADHVIDYRREDFTRNGLSYDLILDCQCFRSMRVLKNSLKPGGTYAFIGGSIARVYQLWLSSMIGSILRSDRKLVLVAEGPNKGLAELSALLEAGKLSPLIDKTFTLDEVPAALNYFAEGRFCGKIGITMGD